VAIDIAEEKLGALWDLGLCDETIAADATRAITVLERVQSATRGSLCDLVINCASVPNTEMATVLSVKPGGTAIVFSMATNFSAAALGAEMFGERYAGWGPFW
jgi:L-erythro-3,5-diaminohexanoate dehydrogenase